MKKWQYGFFFLDYMITPQRTRCQPTSNPTLLKGKDL